MPDIRQSLAFVLLLTLLGVVWLLFPHPVKAQLNVNFDFGFSLVTANVPDITPPSIPVLISPEDEEVVVVSKPTFQWYGSTDDVGVTSYQLWIDSGLYLINIPTTDQETAFYTLVYDEINNIYSLTVKQVILDGDHTWSVVAVDAAGNEATSATWSFTVDTLAPNLSVTSIEGSAVYITTQDLTTIPTDPVVTSTNAPLISGEGEANTTLFIILSIPGEDTTITTYNIGASGTWSYQFPTLEDNVTATLTLIIEDEAGHTNVISPLYFIHNPAPTATPAPSGTVIVTATPTPTPTGPTATPSPTTRPATTVTPPTIYLSALTPTPFPTPPAAEQSPLQPVIDLLNQQKADFVVQRGRSNVSFVSGPKRPLWEWLSFLVLLLPLLIATLLVTNRFGRIPDYTTLKIMWWLFGFDRNTPPDGEVHDRESLEGLWLIPIKTHDIKANKEYIASVTNRYGDFILPQLDNSVYTLHPEWSGLQFPTTAKRPQSLPWHRFYLGEKVTYDTNLPWPFIHIPVDRLRLQPRWEARILEALEWKGTFVVMQTIIICLIYILSPSLVTGIPLVMSLLLGFLRFFIVRKQYSTNKS